MIHLLGSRATPEQLTEMLDELVDYVKLAVDIERKVIAGGGELHADCEAVLLADGSQQKDVWVQIGCLYFRKFDTNPSSTFVRAKITHLWKFSIQPSAREIFEGV